MKKYTQQQLDFLRVNAGQSTRKELLHKYNKRFQNPLTNQKLKSLCGYYGFKTIPQPCISRNGNIYKACYDNGDRRNIHGGYIEIKIDDNWIRLHRLTWERVHGPVPAGHVLFFLDRNPKNCKISNLALLKKSELHWLNRHSLITNDSQLNLTAINIARLVTKLNEKTQSMAFIK